MIVIKDLKNQSYKNLAVALGNFDGVHIAHQEIIKTCTNYAKNHNIQSAVITFTPHPREVMNPSAKHESLITPEQKLELFERLGVDIVYLINFTPEFANIPANEFISRILVQTLQVQHVITGYNFLFGKNRRGNSNLLSKSAEHYNFSYQQIGKISYNYHDISSSNIKALMKLGAFGIVNELLGREYSISGNVVEGNKRARMLGFPTANIALKQELFYPLYGVYLVKVEIEDKELYGIANIGLRPTFSEIEPILEVHIFDFDNNIYDKQLKIKFLHFIRPERKFSDIDELKTQVISDIQGAKYALKNLPGSCI
ncbi:riboflavin kinase/FMN adenylyltransferase [endosymbiont of Acanthamoeba sp. UWC8]|uniref:bifunctional riboflavin kinase/FAD synthetase n=1 Tax=endosymbiont of Acanthamoeba sp. UWC8 TaxID=86106 RepID=UPI0004D177D5|nr:bifunctional riboflavin kinase/FAD synthetase [endosymbiont of Acanthamoeba sp. UWC8]AIF81879.1 riboflavin kinase/FMN adenylyltransferase [endosymbiont of Acanthamoeba sp. UWC8]